MAKEKETFYTILNLNKDCTSKDIKMSFIELSKKYHPDKNKSQSSHGIFVKLNEAYNVLSKPASRKLYDDFLQSGGRKYNHYYDNVYTSRNDAAFWRQKERGDFTNGPYYGVKGIKKVSNTVILIICATFAIVGAGAQFLAIRKSFNFDRERMKHDSARNQILWELSKKEANEKGNTEQIAKFLNGTLRGATINEANAEYGRRLREEAENING